MLKKILSLLADVMTYGVSSLLSQVIGVLLLPLYTWYLTPADQWQIAMLALVGVAFGPLGHLGMTAAVFRRFSLAKTDQERGEAMSTALSSVVFASLVAAALGCLAAGEISRLIVGDTSIANLVRLTLLGAAATTIGAVPMAVLRAGRRVKTAAAINVAKLLITVCTTIWLVVFLGWGVRGVVVGVLAGEAALCVVQFAITAHAFRYTPSLTTWKGMAAYGLPFVPHHLQGLVMICFAQYWVGRMMGETEGGLYSFAIKLTTPIVFVVNAVQNAWVAYKFEIHANDEDPASFFRTAVTYYVAGILYLWVGVSLWGPEVIWLLTNPSYEASAWLVPAAAVIPVSQGFYYMFGTGIELTDNTRPVPLISLAGLITTVACSLLLVPRLGAIGAAASTAAAWLAMAVTVYTFSQRRFAIPYDWTAIASLVVLALLAVGVGYSSLTLSAGPRLTVAVVVSILFPLIEFAVLYRSESERHRMHLLLTKVRLVPSSR
ncbi:MAG: lipopolysaccharide biosynthesis protein [Pirellulales bacterium]